jgi:DNA-binding MarR family transcriptional regulator
LADKVRGRCGSARQPLIACNLVANAYRQIGQRYAAELRSLSLSFAQMQVLNALERSDGQNPGALTEALAARGSSMTDLLDQLETQGLIERRADPDDRRALRVCLTAAGRRRQREATRIVEKFNGELSRRLTKDEIRAFLKVMHEIRDLTTASGFEP